MQFFIQRATLKPNSQLFIHCGTFQKLQNVLCKKLAKQIKSCKEKGCLIVERLHNDYKVEILNLCNE
jgi:hypothetical protein